ncbi:MAG: lactate racemase domain-containing protein [Sporomusaceae bacterium]|nr:lactate racemase domain-containing protein [Sporomusaceae bacterium]
MNAVDRLLDGVAIPRVVRVRQSFERPQLKDAIAELAAQLKAKGTLAGVKRGQKIAITAGSRGITALPAMLRTLANAVREAGGEAFLVPAMGSHGGATAEGQRSMLAGMGITEDAVGAPIRATMETVEVGRTAAGLPVYLDRYAYEADGIIVVNRIKPHVAFRGPYESGLAKMLVIGLGKQRGADTCHDMGAGMMAENIREMAAVTLAGANVIAGVAIIENAYHETSRLAVLAASEIMAEEPALLEEAWRLCPRLFFDSLDVLVIDEIGKDISGTGFDTNVVGRYHTPNISGGPRIARVAVLDLTARTKGNANGLGLADFTTRRVFDKFDFANTYPNSLTTTAPASVKIPMVLGNDRQAIQAAIKTCNIADKGAVRLVRIRNTVALDEIEVAESLLAEVAGSRCMAATGEPYGLPFDAAGNLL